MANPLVSIVIPTLNASSFVGRAIRSVIDQGYPNTELIVVDGGSSDCTADVVYSFRSSVAHFVTEKDRGAATAINKGLRICRGAYFNWLGADDELCPGGLAALVTELESKRELTLVAGRCHRVFHHGHARISGPPADFVEKLTYLNLIEQPSCLMRTDHVRLAGGLREEFRNAFDWDLWCRLHARGAKFASIDAITSVYNFSTTNLTSTGGRVLLEEMFTVLRAYGPMHGLIAHLWRILYFFDLLGCYDSDGRPSLPAKALHAATLAGARALIPREYVDSYNWNWLSRQERGLVWT